MKNQPAKPSQAPGTSPPAAVVEWVPLFEAQKRIYPKTTTGTYTSTRWLFVWLTQLLYYGLPWLEWSGRQAVLFDLGARRFYTFGFVLYPQDFIYLTGLLVASALLLFFITAIAGRLWCGYTCPQTVYSSIFMYIERKVEGDRNKRIRLDNAPTDVSKISRKALKHALWLLFSIWTGITFVGYFYEIRKLVPDLFTNHVAGWSLFWVVFYSFATYGNAGFLREQVCKYMCPYARFQSAMFDKDTLIVSYDAVRGEPRGGRSKGADAKSNALGSCIDCSVCMQVCPTGIDIRNGLQYECIGCGVCVDACNSVMDKMEYPRGLIRYTTENALKGKFNQKELIARILRPRVLIYASILGSLLVVLGVSLSLRTPFKVDVVRDRAVISRIAQGGLIENVFRLQLMNATEQTKKISISASGPPALRIASATQETLLPTESKWMVVSVHAEPGSAPAGAHKFMFQIDDTEGAFKLSESAVFIFPR
jgi:cytochrome c oxidase accessory protein FixG